MWLGIDIGNTREKYFLIKKEKIEVTDFSTIPWDGITKIGIVKTGNASRELESKLNAFQGEILRIDTQLHLPFNNQYQSPSLGSDRIALCAGGIELYQSNFLIIDAGTCITYDYVDEKKNYRGGAISPGIGMRYRALHDYTAGLPRLWPEKNLPPLTGSTTETSIHSGVINGVIREIQGITQSYQEQYPGIKVVLTGGEGVFLFESLKIKIFALKPDLMAYGIKRLLEIN